MVSTTASTMANITDRTILNKGGSAIMESKKTTILLAVLCILLAGATAFLYLTKDRQGPEIKFSADIPSYIEGQDTAVLLMNVTAYDVKDKDVTNMVKVDSVTPLLDGVSAKVSYIVKDSSNNITTAVQTVTYNGKGQGEIVKPEETAATPAEEDNAEDAAAGEEGTTEPETTAAPTPTEAPAEDATIPVLTLTQTAVTLNKGETFRYYNYIESMTDDKDSSDYLAQHIHVDGDTDTNSKGTKEVKYYLIDSDGNQSKTQTLTLTVQ